jgi:hypothetical protein
VADAVNGWWGLARPLMAGPEAHSTILEKYLASNSFKTSTF